MSKASFRRGAVRLSSTFGSGHTSLQLVVSELSHTRQKHKDLLKAHSTAFQSAHKWSQDDGIAVLQDVLKHVSELAGMWADAQSEFIVALKDYKRVYERILEMDKRLDVAKKQLQVCEERERKLQREMVKGPKPGGVTHDKLQHAVDAKNLAQTEVTSQKRETDALKMASVRAGLMELSQSWASLGRKCTLLAESQMELAKLIPDVNTRLQEVPPYNDAHESQQIIFSTRRELEHLDPPKYSSAALAGSFSSPSSTSSLPPYEPSPPSFSSRPVSARPSSAGYRSSYRPNRYSESSVAVVPSLPQQLEQEDSFDSFDSD